MLKPKNRGGTPGARGRPPKKSSFREYARSLGFWVGLALLTRAFVAEAYVVPTGSMIPTLEVGDRIFTNRYIYGLKVPWVEHKLTDGRLPKPGEVIIFVDPKGTGETLVKRVMAVGGETVEVRDDAVFRNGAPVRRRPLTGEFTYLDGPEGSDNLSPIPCDAFEEVLSGITYRVFHHRGAGPSSFGPVTVPPGHVFVMGDNRDNSSDSRFWGTVPRSHIKGRVSIIYWSSGPPDGVRPDRFFTRVR